ncbi:hypothetical protein [Microbacterium halotolerans]|uniref:hypothetical protein n=1 Tax=Microbacterium halotolerans TaxID=246613 RepID=UPI000E6AE12D|nr:hypothetical protein [Microbacterium halotolerans]
MPKGLSEETRTATIDVLRGSGVDGAAALTLATDLGVSRVTARRCLDHLFDHGLAARDPRSGRTGRPENVYRWVL